MSDVKIEIEGAEEGLKRSADRVAEDLSALKEKARDSADIIRWPKRKSVAARQWLEEAFSGKPVRIIALVAAACAAGALTGALHGKNRELRG